MLFSRSGKEAEQDVSGSIVVPVTLEIAIRTPANEELAATQGLVQLAALPTSLGGVSFVHEQHLATEEFS